MMLLERCVTMTGWGPTDTDGSPAPCVPDGPVASTGTVLEAVECDTARYVALAPVARDVKRTYLILTRVNEDGDTLSYSDITSVPEVQNAIAHFGPRTKSVRILSHPGRRRPLIQTLEELGNRTGRTYEYAGEAFRLSVRVG